MKPNLVRFSQNGLLDFISKYIKDDNGNLRQFVKEATSVTISTDQGKGIVASTIFD